MTFLALRGLEKTFPDGTRAVGGVDLDVSEGEFVVLLGPSGCGKTTTLRMVAGLESSTGGSILLRGRDVTHAPPSERDAGFVFQFFALYPHMTVAENLAFPLECVGMPRAERRRAVEETARRLGLVDLLPRRPRQLSGGDQQRVAVARATVRRRSLVLMDEPLGTLDADRRLETCEVLRAQQIATRTTTLYVTHDQEEAMRLADRIVVLSGGAILQIASPREVYDRPATLFVARFVGSPGMNLLPGEVADEDGARVFRPRGGLAAVQVSAASAPGPAVLGLRPEALRLDAGGPWRGRVVASEFLGADRCVHVETAGGRIVARADAESEVRAGDEVRLASDPGALLLFDPATEALRP